MDKTSGATKARYTTMTRQETIACNDLYRLHANDKFRGMTRMQRIAAINESLGKSFTEGQIAGFERDCGFNFERGPRTTGKNKNFDRSALVAEDVCAIYRALGLPEPPVSAAIMRRATTEELVAAIAERDAKRAPTSS
jgi:hypothetical protein